MRKIDYQTLAQLIRAQLAQCTRTDAAHAPGTPERYAAIVTRQALLTLAGDFAQRASVDRAAFLAACGIDPDA